MNQSEMKLCAQDCGENWMFSCTKTLSRIVVEVLCLNLIALDVPTDDSEMNPAVATKSNLAVRFA